MKAILLVGGFGTRLRPLTLTTPKPMLPVGQRPMIEHVVNHLARHGVDQVVLSLGFRPDVFAEAYPSGTCCGVELVYAVEPEPLDTAGAIRYAAGVSGLEPAGESFIVVNGDVLADVDLTALVAFHRDRGAEATLSLCPVEDPSAFGVVPTDDQGRVLAFIEKPKREEAPTNLINAGTYVLETSVLARIPAGRKVSIERETFPAMVADGTVYAMATDGYWLDTGRPDQYLQANLDAIDQVRQQPMPAPPIAEGAQIDDGATVTHSVIGLGCRIAAGAVVIDSVLLPGASVAFGARVERSMLGPGASVGEGSTLFDTVVGADTAIEANQSLVDARVPAPGP
jgi:mannose-1-phosphate guanylyltransferase